MSYRYEARVKFPSSALAIAAVAAAVQEARDTPWYDVDHADGMPIVEVSGGECSHGEIDITQVLDEHRVPYDHWHSVDCAPAPEPYTVYVRWPADPEQPGTETEISDEDEADAGIARELLQLLDAGDLDKLRARLNELRDAGPPPDVESLGWQPPPLVRTEHGAAADLEEASAKARELSAERRASLFAVMPLATDEGRSFGGNEYVVVEVTGAGAEEAVAAADAVYQGGELLETEAAS
jgi:hypothetical protein